MGLLEKQLRRLYVHIINSFQKSILGDDPVSIIIRGYALRLLGAKVGAKSRILGGTDFLGGNITIGDCVCINRNCYFNLSGHVYIEDNVGIGHGTTFITAEHEMGPPHNRAGHVVKGLITGADIKLCKGSWVGANVTILANITVGAGAVVATCSLVNKNVEANSVVFGCPARKVKTLEES